MVRPVAVAAKQRLAALPDVPTFAEAGLPQYDVTNWFGIMAPKGTPMEAVNVVNRAVAVMLKDPSVLKRLNDGGMLAMHESAEDFQKRIVADDIKWRDIVKAAGIQPQ
jgi:tripartite-type tricarboxylate transporter receptor subunit TctC